MLQPKVQTLSMNSGLEHLHKTSHQLTGCGSDTLRKQNQQEGVHSSSMRGLNYPDSQGLQLEILLHHTILGALTVTLGIPCSSQHHWSVLLTLLSQQARYNTRITYWKL